MVQPPIVSSHRGDNGGASKTGNGATSSKKQHSVQHQLTSKKRKHQTIAPAAPSKYSSYELFGTDSEDDDDNGGAIKTKSSKHGNNMFSYFTIKYHKAYSRQIRKYKLGNYYFDLKVYDTNKSNALNKRPQPQIAIKNRTNCDTEAWYHLKKFIEASRRQTKQCTMFTMFNEDDLLMI